MSELTGKDGPMSLGSETMNPGEVVAGTKDHQKDFAGLDIAKSSVRGSVVLFIGNLTATVIGAITIILIARMLGPEQYGVYALALVIPGLLQLFLGFGVNNAVIRFSAFAISQGKRNEARRYTINGILFIWSTGAVLTLLNFVLAGALSVLLLHRPDLTSYVQLMSLSTFGATMMVTVTFTAMAWNWMSLSSLSVVLQNAVKFALSALLIVLGLGVTGALVGHMASLLAAGLLGTSIFYVARLRGKREAGRFVSGVKEMLMFGLPLYAGGLISGLAGYFVTAILAAIASNTVFGFYQAANNFVSPIMLISNVLVMALFPAFASLDGIGGNVKQAFKLAYKFVAFLLTPFILFMVSASGLIINLFYGASYAGSTPYLELLALANLPIAFGYTVHPAFFTGFGRPRLTMFVYLSGAVTLIVGAPLFSILLDLGVDGLIYATFLSLFVAWVVGTVLAERYMKATLDWKANGAVLLASIISFAATGLLPRVFSSSILTLFLDVLVFFTLFLTLAPLAGAVNGTDLETMEYIFKDLKLVKYAATLLLRYERFVLSIRGRIGCHQA